MVLNIAHRGIRSTHQENTLEAFKEAIKLGANGNELDIRLDQEGTIVVFHDPHLRRISENNDHRFVHEVSLEELSPWNIPSLRSVLQWVKSASPEENYLFIEMKYEPETQDLLPEKLINLLKEENMMNEHLFVISFHEDFLREVKGKCPEIQVGLTFDLDQKYSPEKYISLVNAYSLDVLTFHIHLLTSDLAKVLKEKNIRWGVWGIEKNIEEAKTAIEFGAHYLITDIPEEVRKLL